MVTLVKMTTHAGYDRRLKRRWSDATVMNGYNR